jgi:tetratricopeptide (TPR) repeat protein
LLERIGPWCTGDRRWIGAVAAELANVRALIERLGAAHPEMAQQLACTLGRFHDATHTYSAGIDELTRAADALVAPTQTRVALLAALADLHLRGADIESARAPLALAVELRDAVGAPAWNEAAVDRSLGGLACRTSAYDEAIKVARAALDRGISRMAQARMHNLEGIARYANGDLAGALAAFERELDVYTAADHEANIASAHGNLAEIALQLGDRAGAARHQQACLERAIEIGQPVMLAYSCILAGRLAAIIGDWPLAVRLESAGDHELQKAGLTLYDADRDIVDRLLADAAVQLGEEAVAAEAAAARQLHLVDASRLATSVFSAIQQAETSTDPVDELVADATS